MSIEELVRDSLRERVEIPPALHEPADRAVSAARRIRRRRRALVATGVALVLAAATVQMGTAARPAPPANEPPVPSSSPAGAAFVVGGDTLLLPSGRPATLAGQAGAIEAVQLPQGWFATSHTVDTETLTSWIVAPDGRTRPVLSGLTAWPVAASDGRTFAWRDGSGLHTGHLSERGDMVVDHSTTISGTGFPVALTDRAVVLGTGVSRGPTDGVDLWFPARGAYVPTWNVSSGVVGVFGWVPGRRTVIGLVRQSPGKTSTCLAELDPERSLQALRTECGVHLRSEPPGAVSPDGHWLAAQAGDGRVAVIDLTVQHLPAAVVWPADRPGTWIDEHTMVAPAGGQPRRFDVTSGTGEPVEVPGLTPGTRIEPVPRA
jgi:hypothetical protein